MIREVFHIGSFSVSPFGVMLMVAFLAAYAQLSWGLTRLGAGDREDSSALLLWAGLGGIAGAKIYYAVLYRDWRLILDRSGLVWYGGFLLGGAAVLWIMRRRRLPAWPTADAGAVALALGYGVGRIGCFLVGDDYGVPTDLPWGVRFPVGLPPTQAGWLRSEFGLAIPDEVPDHSLLAVHPTQLYETVIALGIWLFGRWLLVRQRRSGSTALAVVVLLSLERFAVELLRAKDDRFLGAFTVAQLFSAALLLAMVILAAKRWRSSAADAGAPPVRRS